MARHSLSKRVLAIRYGHTRYPYPQDDANAELRSPHRRD